MRSLLVLLLTLGALPATAGDRITGKPFASRSEVIALHGMAATSQPLATNAALDILKAGGSAVDAAIAANAMLGLVEPTGNGIGGDLFALVWDARSQRLYGLNASGRSPKGLTLATLRERLKSEGLERLPPLGPLPVSVPGAVDGWFELHGKFGRLPMKQLLAPAIRSAREGHPVSELIAYYWARSVPRLAKFPGFREQMTLNGQAPKKGEIWKNPHLANSLEAIAKGGRKAFYQGRIAHTIADYVQAQGGYLSYEDLASHRSEWVEPVSTNYRGYEVWELPPNSQGIAVLQMLNLLEAYDLAKAGYGSPEHLHWFIEAKKIAFEDRAKFYADPAFNKLPVAELISKPYAQERRKLLDPTRAAKRIEAGNPALRQGDTIYLTTADAEGNMVSLIQSNYRGMGSGMTPPGLGFVLQDRGEMFSLEDGHANVYAPGKRPFQTIIPAFISKDGKPWVSFGVMGGDMQPQGHVQIVMNLIDFGMNLQEAGDAPRIYHTGSSEPTGELMTDGGVVNLESGFPAESVRSLLDKGHQLGWDLGGYGGYQAILRDPKTGVYYGASESRKDGMAAGY
ncbi:gamma-glutamyltransferase [Stagnimonas aquatica]|uniref:Glutathione hydrolase proenzyme n=1 Tax=Stagnimonas aquatica TaxID=2689987 RepID=A0A3N0V546_9GAMM|nr:gamma-glutamyltransferase [Stagnimonas aquatica]ROH87833.1 gamma-glutamyltransferase [Stagnimonas aquatica]